MIQLFGFQSNASSQIATRFEEYMDARPYRGTVQNPLPVPFYQALEAITGAGKTAVLADSVERMRPVLPVQPFVLWLSKGRVVVSQTLANLSEAGKYRHLIGSFDVHLLSDYRPDFATDEARAHLFFATVGTFNQRDKERGDRLIYKSEIDVADISIWEAIKRREAANGVRRPLIVVYDEAQNLSDQQMALLLELQPDAFVVASATMKIPAALGVIISDLKREGWTDERLITRIPSDEVAVSGLIKDELSIGGYQTPMERTIDEMLADLAVAEKATFEEKLPFRPKAIYVCKTNIVEGNAFQRDDPKQPFKDRKAPPILIWRHLVEQHGIATENIAVYSSLDFDKNFPPPEDFVLFKGGDSDYDDFVTGNYQHVIFNLSLQEGWDDPSCYFAYIDKSMGSNVQVEQLVGRVLRQPGATHYASPALNIAHFYIRVDAKGVFAEVVDQVRKKIQQDAPTMRVTTYGPGVGPKPEIFAPAYHVTVPKLYLDSSAALEPVQRLIDDVNDYRRDSENVRGEGARALIQQRITDTNTPEVRWVPIEHNNPVSARWVFQRAVNRQYPEALHVAGSDHEKFDAKVEVGSRAYRAMERLADDVVKAYFQYARLRQRPHNPYVVGDIIANASKIQRFNNSLHVGYASLNPLEQAFAEALDTVGVSWARNLPRVGFGIPLLSIGKTRMFYPDFLVWIGDDVFAIDTTGEHLLVEKTGRKLLMVTRPSTSQQRLHVKLLSKGRWNEKVESVSPDGFTVWRMREDGDLGMTHVESMSAAVKNAIVPDEVVAP